MSNYYTKAQIDAKGYLTEHQSLANYALKSEIPTVPTKVSAFANDAGYLTQHQSLDAYALKTEIPSTTDFATKTELSAKQDALTAGTGIKIENGVISVSLINANGVSF